MSETIRYRGRIAQIRICLGKLLRMFLYQNDWKALPMSAIIAGLVTFAVGNNIFKTQEGTMSGCFSLVCVCIWNGFFNSIQSVCRERAIIKREHRSGMHISSYIAAHMIYQMLMCIAQTGILLGICALAGVQYPEKGLITQWFIVDFAVSMFLITYTADMISLAISCIVKNTTTAMTVMPFLLIFQLIFSGGLIYLEGPAEKLTDLTIAKWGLQDMCALCNINSQPNVTLWNTIWNFREFEMGGIQPVKMFTDDILKNNRLDEFLAKAGEYTQKEAYVSTAENVLTCWGAMVMMALLFAVIAIVSLEFVDQDSR